MKKLRSKKKPAIEIICNKKKKMLPLADESKLVQSHILSQALDNVDDDYCDNDDNDDDNDESNAESNDELDARTFHDDAAGLMIIMIMVMKNSIMRFYDVRKNY